MTESTSESAVNVQVPSKEIFTINGYLMLFIICFIVFSALMIGFGVIGTKTVQSVSSYSLATRYTETTPYRWFSIPLGVLAFFCLIGLKTLGPKEVRVVQLFGTPLGVFKKEGLHWINPFFSTTLLNYRVKNFETDVLKINDANGSLITLSAVVSWRVANPELVVYELDDFDEFFSSQVEGNIRNVAGKYPYEHVAEFGDDKDSEIDGDREKADAGTIATLTQSTDEISKEIIKSINEDVTKYGLEAIDVSFNKMGYAPEIAAAMTQAQQAKMVVKAKRELTISIVKIAANAVRNLSEEDDIKLSDNDKSRLATNLTLMLSTNREVDTVISLDN